MNNSYKNKKNKSKSKLKKHKLKLTHKLTHKLKGGNSFEILFDNLKINQNTNRILSNIESSFLVTIDTFHFNQYVIKRREDYIYCFYDRTTNDLFIINNEGVVIHRYDAIIDILKQVNQLPMIKKRRILRENNIHLTFLKNYNNCVYFNRPTIQPIIDELNIMIKKKCPELSLKLDFQYKLPGDIIISNSALETLLLCLYYKGNCISSIAITYKETNILEIDSFTHEQMEGNKYNKILRCVIIIVASKLTCQNNKINEIISNAVNPISAWLLISNFITQIEYDNELFLFINDMKQTNIFELYDNPNKKREEFKKLLFNLYQKVTRESGELLLPIRLQIYDNNVKIAYNLFHQLLEDGINSIKCPN